MIYFISIMLLVVIFVLLYNIYFIKKQLEKYIEDSEKWQKEYWSLRTKTDVDSIYDIYLSWETYAERNIVEK